MESYSYRGVAELRTQSGEPVARTTFWVNIETPPAGKILWEGWLRKVKPAEGGEEAADWRGRYQFVVLGGGSGQIEIVAEAGMKLLETEHVRFRGVSKPPAIPGAPEYPQNPVPYPPEQE